MLRDDEDGFVEQFSIINIQYWALHIFIKPQCLLQEKLNCTYYKQGSLDFKVLFFIGLWSTPNWTYGYGTIFTWYSSCIKIFSQSQNWGFERSNKLHWRQWTKKNNKNTVSTGSNHRWQEISSYCVVNQDYNPPFTFQKLPVYGVCKSQMMSQIILNKHYYLIQLSLHI